MAVDLDTYMAANPSLTLTEALQACVTTKTRVTIAPTSGYRTITQPILFESYLSLHGENQVQAANFSNLLATDLHGRPMFLGGKYVTGNFTGWYLDRDGVYRIVYKGATPSGADTNFASAYTTDKVANLKTLETYFFGEEVFQIDSMLLSNTDPDGSIINSASAKESRFTNLGIQTANRGIHLGSSFNTLIQSVSFQGHTPSWFPMDSAAWARIKAGTGTADDLAAKAVLDAKLASAWGLYVGGNGVLINLRFVDGGTGIAVNGNGCYTLGVAIEKSMYGLVMGGLPFLDINSLAGRTLSTNYTVAGLPSAAAQTLNQQAYVTDSTVAMHSGLGNIVSGGGSNTALVYSDGTNWRIGNKPPSWGTNGGNIHGIDMESCYRGVTLNNSITSLEYLTLTGSNAKELDGATGPCEYGVAVASQTEEYRIKCTINDSAGSTSVRSIGLNSATPLLINEDTIRDRTEAIETDIATLETDKATVASVEDLDYRLTVVDRESAKATELDAVSAIITEQYYPTS